jgi:hypothetical protein
MRLNDRLRELENTIIELTAKVEDLSRNTEGTYKKPISVVGGGKDQSLTRPIDIRSGRGLTSGAGVIWNNTEIDGVYGTQPTTPTIGYNKHAHSRFSGGALIKDVIEIVEYEWGAITNKQSQGFFKPTDEYPKIKVDINTLGETVNKIGLLDLVFNPDTLTWGCPAYEIDVKKCYLVERDNNGDIALDSKGQEKKSPLYNADQTKTSIVWDENGNCFRLYCVYAPGA